jgi:hypothetical protein
MPSPMCAAQGRAWALLPLGLSLFLASPASSESGEVKQLRREVGELKQTVENLGTRLEGIEHQLAGQTESKPSNVVVAAPSTEPGPTPARTVSLRDRWHRVTQGMTLQQVEELLGRPARTIEARPNTIWYYSYPEVGNGSIVFANDGSVMDWQPPPFNTWW